MTLEQDSKSEENCNLRPAKARHSSSKCLSSPNAPVLHKLQTRLARGWFKWRLLNWKVMRPHTKREHPVQVGMRVDTPSCRRTDTLEPTE